MKRITLFALAVAGCFTVGSCSDDDDNSVVQTDISGTYNLISYNAPVSQDLNGDQESSFNLVSEHDCFSEWQIVLKNDNTFERNSKVLSIENGDIVCATESDSGTWQREGDDVKLLNLEGSEIGSEFAYLEATNSLTQTMSGTYPLQFEGNYILQGGTVTLIYVRE